MRIAPGATSKIIEIGLLTTAGDEYTGLVYNTSGLTCYYLRAGATSWAEVALADMTLGTWVSGGFVEIGYGLYQLGLPDAAVAAGADWVLLRIAGASGLETARIEIELAHKAGDVREWAGTAVVAGAIPAVAAGGAGGLARVDDIPTPPTAAAIADAVLDEDVTAHQGTLDTLGSQVAGAKGSADSAYSAAVAMLTKLSGITSLAAWLRAMVRKSAADATAKSEINSGGGTYNETTDSQEAIRDTAPLGTAMRGTDNAYTGTPPTAAEVRAEMDANSTKLAAIEADTNEIQAELADGGRTDALIDGIKAKTDNLPASPASSTDVPTAAANAAAVVARTELVKILQSCVGRFTYNKSTGAWTVYADDGVTPLVSGVATDDGTTQTRAPS